MSVQTELHRHLDISLRPATVLELAQAKGLIPQSTSLEAFCKKLILTKPLPSLDAVIDQFELMRDIHDRPEVFERVAFEVAEDCYREGTHRVELRYSPSFACDKNGLDWRECLLAFHRGLKRAQAQYPDLEAGFLCIATREFGLDLVEKTVDFFLANQSLFLGFDLAGKEVGFPSRDFQAPMKRLQQAGARITIHAGEASGPDNIWEAIDLLGAQRIGHGIACVRDPKLMQMLASREICLEMCPTSNWLTQVVPSIEAHPLPQVLRAGVPVCVNTDDPTLFGASLPHELELCRTRMGLSEAEILRCQEHAYRASFLAKQS